MARGAATFALMPPPTPHRAPRARFYICVAFLLRPLRRGARVRKSHGRAGRRARYRDGDERRRPDQRCNKSGRRLPLFGLDCKHSANALDPSNLDVVVERLALAQVHDDDRMRIEVDLRHHRAARTQVLSDNVPRPTPPRLVRNQLDRAPAPVSAHLSRREHGERDGLHILGRLRRAVGGGARAALAEHRHAQDFYRRRAVAEQPVVEVADAEGVAQLPAPLFAQAQDLHLAERVDEVGRVERAPARLALGVGARLIALAHEELDRLLVRHPGGVQAYADQVAAQAQERGVQLREPELGVVPAEALVDHHLLAVVRPALDEARRLESRAHARRRLPRLQRLVVVAWEGLVDRGEGERVAVVVREVLLLLLRRPGGVGRRDVVEALGRHALERARRVERGEGERARVLGRLRDREVLARGRRHDLLRAYEGAYAVELGARLAAQAVRRRVFEREQPERGRDAAARRDLLGDRAHLVLRLAQLALALAQERGQGSFDHLLVEQFPAEVLGAERELPRRARQQVAREPVAEGPHG